MFIKNSRLLFLKLTKKIIFLFFFVGEIKIFVKNLVKDNFKIKKNNTTAMKAIDLIYKMTDEDCSTNNNTAHKHNTCPRSFTAHIGNDNHKNARWNAA